MNQHQDIVSGGTGVAIFGWVVSACTWLKGDMSPLGVIATLGTLALTALKIYDAIQRRRKGKPLDSAAVPLGDR